MKTILLRLLVVTAFNLTASAHAEKVAECPEKVIHFPCQVEKEEAELILHTMFLQDPKALKRVRKGSTANPSFEQYRVLLMAEKERPGHGPGTYRNRSVYKIQILVQSLTHGPGRGTGAQLLNVFANQLSSSHATQTRYESNIKDIDGGQFEIDSFAAMESNDPVAKMIADGFEY